MFHYKPTPRSLNFINIYKIKERGEAVNSTMALRFGISLMIEANFLSNKLYSCVRFQLSSSNSSQTSNTIPKIDLRTTSFEKLFMFSPNLFSFTNSCV